MYADVTEVGYLEAEASDGEPISLQFLESPEEAQLELDATVKSLRSTEPPTATCSSSASSRSRRR